MRLAAALFAAAVPAAAATGADLRLLDQAALMELRPSSLELAAQGRIYNREAPVPPQCYTRIDGRHNPCYVCHQYNTDDTRPNFMQDGGLQAEYAFSDAGTTNHYRNLFQDRSERVAAISDQEILDWINQENYTALPARLEARSWKGWTPDLAGLHLGAAAFDGDGHALDGSGWVAFNYKPMPSTFWPTNGSTDDVFIRLPDEFRQARDGTPSRDVYTANLALLELAFQDLDRVTLPPVDEASVGADVDGDGAIGRAGEAARRKTYFGAASDRPLVRMIYPEGTEFLHSVRYVGVEDDGITIPPRMKELRYMVKTRELDIPRIKSRYGNERQEKTDERLPRYVDLGDTGMDTGMGWTLLAFIEDAGGRLRPQTNEEQFFCRGCHATVGANIDQTWAFPRKLRGAKGWGYVDYRAIDDAPNVGADGRLGEYATYFIRAGGGDEFRSNAEMIERWFKDDGSVDLEAVESMSVYDLIAPSPGRALELNKAYKTIVDEQTFVFGRDATVTPPENVHADIEDPEAHTLPPEFRFDHDIRLDWEAAVR